MKTSHLALIGGAALLGYLWLKGQGGPQAPTAAQIQGTYGAAANVTAAQQSATAAITEAMRAQATAAPTVSSNGTVNLQTLGTPLSPTGGIPGLSAPAYNVPTLPPALNPAFTAPGSGFAMNLSSLRR